MWGGSGECWRELETRGVRGVPGVYLGLGVGVGDPDGLVVQ